MQPYAEQMESIIDPMCDCGHTQQTIHHIVNECPKRKFHCELNEINELTDDAIEWIRNKDIYLWRVGEKNFLYDELIWLNFLHFFFSLSIFCK